MPTVRAVVSAEHGDPGLSHPPPSGGPAPGAEAIGVEPAAVPYVFNAGTNSAGEPGG